mgnify:CR=1 FL=1
MEDQKRNPAQGLSESEQVQVRRQKLADLQAAGNDPFTLTKYPQDAYSADLKEEFKDLPNETDSGKQVALAGRMMSKRVMGKASFAHLRDDKGDIQIFVKRDLLGDEPYAAFKKLDIGDIIGVKGEVFRTKMGEISVPSYELMESEAEIPSLLVGLVSFNSERSESTALYDLVEDGTLDWLESDDFKSLPVPLNQVAGEWLASR